MVACMHVAIKDLLNTKRSKSIAGFSSYETTWHEDNFCVFISETLNLREISVWHRMCVLCFCTTFIALTDTQRVTPEMSS
jgi:hypothetical protein